MKLNFVMRADAASDASGVLGARIGVTESTVHVTAPIGAAGGWACTAPARATTRQGMAAPRRIGGQWLGWAPKIARVMALGGGGCASRESERRGCRGLRTTQR